MKHQNNLITLIDLGSSTVKLGVYDKSTKALLEKKAETVNMAEDFYPDMVLTEPAIKRVLTSLKSIKTHLKSKGITTPVLVTTGVARKAQNIDDLKARIKKATEWDLEVISGDREAEIFYKGVAHDFAPDMNIVAINIGGGSTEITFGTNEVIHKRVSLPIGVSNMNEQFVTYDPPLTTQISKMFEHIKQQLATVVNGEYKPVVLIHTGGELTYMQITEHPLEDSSYSPTHPKMISTTNFKKRFGDISTMKKEELYKFMPENPHWMDGAVSCTAIALAIAEKLGTEIVVPSDKNLTDGLLLEYLQGGGE